MSRRPRLSRPRLRVRVAGAFALVSLVLAVALSSLTYLLVRNYLLDNRERLATRQAFLNARVAKSLILTEASGPKDIVESLSSDPGAQVLLFTERRWYASSVAIDPTLLPGDLLSALETGSAARQRVVVGGVPHLAIGTPLVAAGTLYVEVVPLSELARTLRALATTLVGASILAVATGSVVGWWASRRLLAPLEKMSSVAVEVSTGRFERRLDDEGDRDLAPLVSSFNGMVDALKRRIDREARFASDVSHELRTPLTALVTAVDIVHARREEMPARVRPAIDVLERQVAYFQQLVLDLLEISRLDAGVDPLSCENVDLPQLVAKVSEQNHGPPVELASSGPWDLRTDRRRLERVVANLLDNAERHAGGATRIGIRRRCDTFEVTIDDDGPGIPPEVRSQVFERFWRGPAARQHSNRGTGLGLSLVEEQVRIVGGTVAFRDNPSGGARAVIELPAGHDGSLT